MNLFKSLAKAYYRALGYYPTRLDGLKFNCDPYNIAFWRTASSGVWEPRTFKILSKYLNHNSVFYDIGAWIGPTTIFAAKKCKQVVCFEPDPVAYQYLLWNIRLNELRNVLPMNVALAERDALMGIASFWNNLGDSMTSLLKTDSTENTADVLALSWKTWMEFAKTEIPTFLKIDIEGGEFAFLPTIKDYLSIHKPILYLSTHAPYLNENLRKEQMSRILEVMTIYKNCLNENLEPVSINDLIAPESLEKFHSYILSD